MKVQKILSHPLLILLSFLFIIISGEHTGGFYMLYILMGLPYLSLASILAVGAVVFISVGSFSVPDRKALLKCCLNVSGAIFAALSLMTFFLRDRKGYNSGTFEQTVPLISIVLFCILVIIFTYSNVWGYVRHTFSRFPNPRPQ